MAQTQQTLRLPWSDGNGEVVLSYTGEGDGTVTVRSTSDNLGPERTMTLTLRTADGARSAQIVLRQPTGLGLLIDSADSVLADSTGSRLRVYPSADLIPDN